MTDADILKKMECDPDFKACYEVMKNFTVEDFYHTPDSSRISDEQMFATMARCGMPVNDLASEEDKNAYQAYLGAHNTAQP